MSDENCMFQYATRHKILADTDLISLDCANKLFNKNIDDFKKRFLSNEEPEMCIWINCKDNSSYGEKSIYWHSDDIKVVDGEMYQKM